jgi:hypothetical protein
MVLVEKTEGKRSLERPRCRLQDDINMNLGEIGWDGMDWIYLAQDTDKWRVLMNIRSESL